MSGRITAKMGGVIASAGDACYYALWPRSAGTDRLEVGASNPIFGLSGEIS